MHRADGRQALVVLRKDIVPDLATHRVRADRARGVRADQGHRDTEVRRKIIVLQKRIAARYREQPASLLIFPHVARISRALSETLPVRESPRQSRAARKAMPSISECFSQSSANSSANPSAACSSDRSRSSREKPRGLALASARSSSEIAGAPSAFCERHRRRDVCLWSAGSGRLSSQRSPARDTSRTSASRRNSRAGSRPRTAVAARNP